MPHPTPRHERAQRLQRPRDHHAQGRPAPRRLGAQVGAPGGISRAAARAFAPGETLAALLATPEPLQPSLTHAPPRFAFAASCAQPSLVAPGTCTTCLVSTTTLRPLTGSRAGGGKSAAPTATGPLCCHGPSSPALSGWGRSGPAITWRSGATSRWASGSDGRCRPHFR
jgi:hypothetical protein